MSASDSNAARLFGQGWLRLGPVRFFQVLLLVAWIGVSGASAESENLDALIDNTLKASGLYGQFEDLPEALLSWLPDEAFAGRKTRREALDVLKKASEECAVRSVHSALKRDLDRETLGTVQRFYDSNLGRKVGRLQGSALAPRLMYTIREGRKFAVTQDDRRMELIGSLIRAEDISAASKELANTVVGGMLDGARGLLEIPGEESKAAAPSVESKALDVNDVTEEAAFIAFSHTYSSLSDKELEEFVEFSESEAAARFRKSVRKGLNEAVYTIARALGVALSRGPGQGR